MPAWLPSYFHQSAPSRISKPQLVTQAALFRDIMLPHGDIRTTFSQEEQDGINVVVCRLPGSHSIRVGLLRARCSVKDFKHFPRIQARRLGVLFAPTRGNWPDLCIYRWCPKSDLTRRKMISAIVTRHSAISEVDRPVAELCVCGGSPEAPAHVRRVFGSIRPDSCAPRK